MKYAKVSVMNDRCLKNATKEWLKERRVTLLNRCPEARRENTYSMIVPDVLELHCGIWVHPPDLDIWSTNAVTCVRMELALSSKANAMSNPTTFATSDLSNTVLNTFLSLTVTANCTDRNMVVRGMNALPMNIGRANLMWVRVEHRNSTKSFHHPIHGRAILGLSFICLC